TAGQVPDTLRDFTFRNAIRIDPGQDFDHHLDRLTREMDRILAQAFEPGGERSVVTAPTTMVTQAAETASDQPAPKLPDRPSIAVMPFQNMSGDLEQQYFVDGMVEEIITALSRIRWLFVITRSSSFSYQGQSPDMKKIGRE